MYLFIPLALLAVSLMVLVYAIGRKFIYLKKLTPEAISDPPATSATFWNGMFSEVAAIAKKINGKGYRVAMMTESEKLLRRMRLVFLKIETLIHSLALRMRRSAKRQEEVMKKEEAVEEALVEVPRATILDPKEEEQRLIMEIAKNPKDKLLYLRLGDIYLKMNDRENARLSFQTVLDLDPENWYAKKKLADLPA